MSKRKDSQKKLVFLLLVVVGTGGAGCVRFQRPPAPEAIEERWGSLELPGIRETKVSLAEEGDGEWWRVFQDPKLEALLSRAVEANKELLSVGARVRQARAVRNASRAELFPVLSARGAYQRTETVGDGSGAAARSDGEGAQGYFDATWELDLFGVRRTELEAGEAELRGTRERYVDALRTLRAEVTLAYIDLRASEAQLRVTEANLRLQEEGLKLAKKRFEGGFATQLEVSQAEGILLATEALLPSLQSDREAALNALSLLVVRSRDEVRAQVGEGGIPVPPPSVSVPYPEIVLNRRPDIRAREAELEAAFYRRGVAERERFPKITLSALFGAEGESLSRALSPEARLWSVGSNLVSPLLTFGRIGSKIDLREAEEEEALYRYQQTVLTAVREAETALSGFQYEREREGALRGVVDSNRRTLELAQKVYAEGLGDFLAVLEAERAVLSAESQQVLSQRSVARGAVTLYKALGGGWSVKESERVKSESQRRSRRSEGKRAS